MNANFALGDSDAPRAREGEGGGGRRKLTRKRGEFHADLLHQPPALRRTLGRELVVDAMLGTLGHRVRTAALDFASWGPSAGILLVLATVAAIVWTNSPVGPAFEAIWRRELRRELGRRSLSMSILHWVNEQPADGVLPRRRTGSEARDASRPPRKPPLRRASDRRRARRHGRAGASATRWSSPAGPWSRGWGVPMATDTAFAIALTRA